jgi:CDP-diacylglycerol---glycerol-3-phosphate 3-phosphatidyltransferase
MDQACSLGLLISLGLLWATHTVRSHASARPRFERVDMEGASALLSRGMLESLYGAIVPIGRAFTRLELGPNSISGMSVLLALTAGGLFAADHLGVGCVFAIAALGSDALDGFVARASGTASSAGEVIDAAADRYVELSLFAGLAVHLRFLPGALVLTLAALAGSFMVTYSTAKAEALSVVPPRGSMRRTDRAFLLIVGAGLTPLMPALGLQAPWNEAPLLIALLLLAVGTNVSAISRFVSIVRELQARDRHRTVEVEREIAETLPVDR